MPGQYLCPITGLPLLAAPDGADGSYPGQRPSACDPLAPLGDNGQLGTASQDR
jgi:hypothetical protein